MAGDTEIRGSKNLGLIKAIHVGINPPLNKRILWFDDNTNVKRHKYYDFQSATWELLTNGLSSITGHYVYIGFASSCEGADFSLIYNSEIHNHTSILSSPTEITTITVDSFGGKWLKFCGENQSGGNYTYVGFADNCDGENFGLTPSYSTDCEECSWLNPEQNYEQIKAKGNWSVGSDGDGIIVKFQDNEKGDYIIIDLTENSATIPNLTTKLFKLEQAISWTSSDNLKSSKIIEFNTDSSSVDNYLYQNNPSNTTFFSKVIVGSQLIISLPTTIPNGVKISGYFKLQIGNESCQNPQTECFGCRKFMAVLVSQEPINDLTHENFADLWIPISSCGCSDTNNAIKNSIENLSVKIENLRIKMNLLDSNLQSKVSAVNNDLQNFKNSQNSINQDLNQSITNLSNSLSNSVASINSEIEDIYSAFSSVNNQILTINQALTSSSIMTTINSDLNTFISDYFNSTLSPILEGFTESINSLEGRVFALENPIV